MEFLRSRFAGGQKITESVGSGSYLDISGPLKHVVVKKSRNNFLTYSVQIFWLTVLILFEKLIPVFDKILRIRIRTSDSNPSFRISVPGGQVITVLYGSGKIKKRLQAPYKKDFLPWLRRRCSLPSSTWRSEHKIIENITKHVAISIKTGLTL
jgi:hypothetical protein